MKDEHSLLNRIIEKDQSALSTLYDHYSGALYGVILRICKDPDDAQNLLQDTFMTIWDKASQFDSDRGRFYTWAYRIAKNKTLNFMRSSNRLIQTDDFSVYENKENDITNDHDYAFLQGSVKALDAHHQRAIELVYFNGFTHREAHKEMDVPLGTFKSYVRQALKKLQQSYNKALALLFILTQL